MGYLTSFRGWVEQGDIEFEEVLKTLRESDNNDFEFAAWVLSEGEGCRWYEFKEIMQEISKTFPGVVLGVEGHGEEWDDLWVTFFLDGKVQVHLAEITFPEYDPAAWVEEV